MRRIFILNLILLFIIYYLFLGNFASADYVSSLSDYQSNLEKYRIAYQDYLKSKSEYFTYHTLSAETAALNKTKILLSVRDDVLISYYHALKEKIKDTQGIASFDADLQNTNIDNRLLFLQNHKSTISSVNTLNDVVNKSREVDDFRKQMNSESDQVIGTVLLGKVKYQSDKTLQNINLLAESVNRVKNNGNNTGKLERWLLETGNKQQLAEGKLLDAKNLLNSFTPDDYEDMQNEKFQLVKSSIANANQYLNESIANGLEAIKEIINGNYL